MSTTIAELEAELAEAKAALSNARKIMRGGHSDAEYRLPDVDKLREEVQYLENRLARENSGGIGLTR